MATKKTTPIKSPEEVQQNPDNKIDEDYPGYPHAPAAKKQITPVTKEEKKSAGIKNKNSSKTYGH